jgi:Sec-independent protein translocase protein TatA
MREFKKASEEMRESFEEEIKKVEERSSHSTSRDPTSDLPEKTSKPLALPERTGEVSLPKTEFASEKA